LPRPRPDRRSVFLEQARHCDGRSPLYAALCRQLADEPLVSELVDAWRWDVPLRLLGGVHHLVLEGRAGWDAVPEALVREAAFLRRFVTEQTVQTNEVQRSWLLLPCFLEAARRLDTDVVDVVELGPSAGLNLFWDRYAYRYSSGAWGRNDAELTLTGRDEPAVPGHLLSRSLTVRRRVGIDRAPVDVTTEEGARLLTCFVWADEAARLERLQTAIEVLRCDPPSLVRGDYVEVLPRVLADLDPDVPTIVFETASLIYLTRAGRAAIRKALDEASSSRPIASVLDAGRLHATRSAALIALRLAPGRARTLEVVDFHGRWLEWVA
jgi:hypothetical protein